MRTLLAAIVCVAALTGCGGDTEPGSDTTAVPQSPTTGAETSEPGSTETGRAEAEPVLVRMHVSGGFAGMRRAHVVDIADPPSTLTAAQLAQVVQLAGSEAVRGYAGDHVDRGECCDLMEYRVVIRYADGSTVRIVTNDADDPPQAYSRLVDLVSRVR